MAEESFLNNEVVEVNDKIDEVIFDKNSEAIIIGKDINKGVINDTADQLKKKNLDRIAKNKKLDEATNSLRNEINKAQKKEKFGKIINAIFFIFIPSNWIKGIQYFEDLLLTLLLDIPIVMILLSLMYILYIIFTFDQDNWVTYVSKLGGCVTLIILSLIIQINVNSNTKEK
jgi:hypothetical protein